MDHLVRRVAVFFFGLAFCFVATMAFKHRDDWYDWIEGYRDRHPILRSLNPLARLNNPWLSKWNMVWCAMVATLMGVLLMTGAFFGRFDQ